MSLPIARKGKGLLIVKRRAEKIETFCLGCGLMCYKLLPYILEISLALGVLIPQTDYFSGLVVWCKKLF